MQIVASAPVGSDTTPVLVMGGCYFQDHIIMVDVRMYVRTYVHM